MGQIARQSIGLLIGLILARILSPRVFGLFGMVIVFTGISGILSEGALVGAVVQRREISQRDTSSLFWLHVLIALGLSAILFQLAPLIALFFREPELLSVVRVASPIFVVSALAALPRSLLVRQLDFKRLEIADFAAVGVGGGLALVMAFSGMGIWSLVAQHLGQAVTAAVLVWTLSGWRPGWSFSAGSVRSLFAFGTNVALSRVINMAGRNLNLLLVGRILGSAPLGIYSLAQRIQMFPVWNVSRVLYRVMFSSLSRISDNPPRVAELFLRMVRVVSFVSFPMMTGLFVTAPLFVELVLGSQWLPLVPVLRIFCVAAVAESMTVLTGNIFLSLDRTDLQLKISSLSQLLALSGVLIGLYWGLIGVAAGYVVASLIRALPAFGLASGLLDLRAGRIFSGLVPTGLASLAMGVFVYGFGLLFEGRLPDVILLLLQVGSGLVSYALLVRLLGVRALTENLQLARAWFAEHTSPPPRS